jgi:hypothetical protein
VIQTKTHLNMNTKDKKVRPSFRTYPLEVYKQFFTEERWEEIQKDITHWENPELKSGKVLKGVINNPKAGICFVSENFEDSPNHQKEHFMKHAFEKVLTDEEYDKCAGYTWQVDHDKREERLFEAAKKVTESEYSGPVFHGDRFYWNTDDFRECWECDFDIDEDFVPTYAYGAIEEYTLNPKDIDRVVENLIENVGEIEDWEPNIPDIPDYLREAWDRFCSEHSETYFTIDYKTAILLDKN